jgi:metalloendopeptidase OMA1, mitochondrial
MKRDRGFRPAPVLCAICALTLIVVACATVPITGRSQFRLFSNDDLVPEANQQFDRFMTIFQEKKVLLPASDFARTEMVKRVSDRIIDASGLRNKYNWQTVVVNYKEANAFVLANGKIVVFRGLLPVAKTEAGLAAIIGHEVGHLVAQHQAERVSQVLMGNLVVQGVSLGLAIARSPYRPAISAATGIGIQYGLLLPFSREHESEADYLGLIFMAKAGYDPAEAPGVWERMEAQNASGPWEFLSTHPSHATRRDQLLAWLPEANAFYADRERPAPPTPVTVASAPQAPAAPIAPRPSFLPGYWWREKASSGSTPLTYRYVRDQMCSDRPGVLSTCFITEAETHTTVLTQDYAILEQQRKDDKPGVKYTPAMKMVDWPLQIGKTWSQNITSEITGGKRVTFTTKGEVVAYESVTVPAGTFMAYKIVATVNSNRILQYWYAPEVRNLVRSERLAAFGLSSMTVEMIDYQKTDEPVIQPEKDE